MGKCENGGVRGGVKVKTSDPVQNAGPDVRMGSRQVIRISSA